MVSKDIDKGKGVVFDFESKDRLSEKETQKQPVLWKEDFWVWQHNRGGDFSVKYGYWLACQINKASIITKAYMKPSLNDLKCQVWALGMGPQNLSQN